MRRRPRPRPGQNGFPVADTVTIDRIAAGGDGVGRLAEGRVVFVPRTAPGDRVRIELVSRHPRYARGRLVNLEHGGPHRVAPRCRHYDRDRCGGCQLQHLDIESQRQARRSIVGDALRRIGKLPVDDPPLEPAADDWGYRTRIALSAGRGRRFGFHRVGEPGRVFDLERCEVADPRLDALWQRVRGARALLPGGVDHLVLRLDREGGEHLLVATQTEEVWPRAAELRSEIATSDRPLNVWWRPPGGAARVLAGGDSPYPATAFEQVNPVMGHRARRFAVDALGEVEGRPAWDLYAGIGETSLLLAERGAAVESVELEPRAVAAAERLHSSRGITVERHTGRVELVAGSLRDPEVVIANPPRGGMARVALDAIRQRAPRRLGYLSCDPATLARDLRVLTGEGAFRLGRVQAFDLFPQTAHVETVAVLERT
jgi:23S rRNA (uracil1939-C5)-methyltransferase